MTDGFRIGVIGCGSIAAALVEGIAGQGHVITVSRRSEAVSSALAARFEEVDVAETQAVLEQSDVVFICLVAEVAREVLPGLTFRPDHAVISVMAGPGMAELASAVAPGRAEAILLPFPSIAHGGSPVLVYPASALAEEIFGRRNSLYPLSDPAELDAYLAAQAVLSPALRLIEMAAAWAGERTGDPDRADGFLRLLVGSTLLSRPPDSAGALAGMLAALNTTGGLNAGLRSHMEAQGMEEALRAGLDMLEAGLSGPS